jgi:hypothetical protein
VCQQLDQRPPRGKSETRDPRERDRIGGDGRLVGVISHIGELTSQFPARVEVEKSQRGSRLKLVVS